MSEAILPPVSFRSRVDVWLVLVLAIALGSAAIPALFGLWSDPDAVDYLGAGIVIVIFLGVAAITLPTRYILTSEGLVIQSGIMSTRLPYRSVLRITRSWNPLAAPAWSLKRLKITYRLQRYPQMALISPVREEEFLELLAERAGLAGEGAERYRAGLAGRLEG